MNTKSTDIERENFEFKDSKEFAKEVLLGMAVSFVVGIIFATAIIMAVLSLVD